MLPDRSTRSGANLSRCGPTKDVLRRADGDAVLVLELCSLLPPAVYGHAVRRAEVEDPVGGSLLPHLGVSARDIRVGEPDVAVLRAPDERAHLVDRMLLAVRVERDDLGLDTQLDRWCG